jgi:hypothetical protein
VLFRSLLLICKQCPQYSKSIGRSVCYLSNLWQAFAQYMSIMYYRLLHEHLLAMHPFSFMYFSLFWLEIVIDYHTALGFWWRSQFTPNRTDPKRGRDAILPLLTSSSLAHYSPAKGLVLHHCKRPELLVLIHRRDERTEHQKEAWDNENNCMSRKKNL